MELKSRKNERIDFRVSPKEKELFLQAQKISGDKSFSAFITRIVKSKSQEIIDAHKQILASEKDKKIFFEAIYASQPPNQALKNAAKKFRSSKE